MTGLRRIFNPFVVQSQNAAALWYCFHCVLKKKKKTNFFILSERLKCEPQPRAVI